MTANKALLAVHGEEIVAAAERAGVRLGFEASVGGGIPILRTLKEGLAGDRTTAVYGIVNGTCNHILTTMTREGRGFDDVLAEAQRLGLAEANPATDIDGIDSAHKLALLTTLAFGVRPRFADIPTEGIRHVDAVDIAFARELGYTIKLLAIAKDGERRDRGARAPDDDSERASARRRAAATSTPSSCAARRSGPTMYYGQGAGLAADGDGGGRRSDRGGARPRRGRRRCACRRGACRRRRCAPPACRRSPSSRASTTSASWRSTARACSRASLESWGGSILVSPP